MPSPPCPPEAPTLPLVTCRAPSIQFGLQLVSAPLEAKAAATAQELHDRPKGMHSATRNSTLKGRLPISPKISREHRTKLFYSVIAPRAIRTALWSVNCTGSKSKLLLSRS